MARRTNSNTRGVPPSGLGRTSSFHGETVTRTRKRSKRTNQSKQAGEVSIFGGPRGRLGGEPLDANGNFTRNGSVYHRASNGEDYLVSWSARARAARTAPSLNRASVSQGGSDDSPV